MKYKFETDSKEEALRITLALDMALGISDFDQWLRAQIKYQDRDLQDIRDEFNRTFLDRGVDIDTIIS